MDSEGSELDDLADLDLATFATAERDANFQSKEGADVDEGRSTETDSLGDSMDSRASSDMLQTWGFEDNLVEYTGDHGGSKSIHGTNPFLSGAPDNEHSFDVNNSASGNITFSSNNPFSPENLQKASEQTGGSDLGAHDILTTSNVKDSSGSNGGVPVPGRPGFTQQHVPLRRLPGESLGMVLAIEGDQDNRRPVEAVLVRSTTPGGAAARVGQDGGSGIQVGDEVREVDGCSLTELTHDQCIDLFQTMPDHVVLTIHREDQIARGGKSNTESISADLASVPVPRPRGSVPHFKASDPGQGMPSSANSTPRQEDDESFMRTPRGFVKLDVTVFRGEGDNLGLSIIPSHGATCNLYQVKRLLPGGACAESGCLEVHDRLVYCNGLSLKGITQAQCLQVLKSSGHFVELTVLRQIDGGSGQYASGGGESAASSTIHSLDKRETSVRSDPQDFPDSAKCPTVHTELNGSNDLPVQKTKDCDKPELLDLLSTEETDDSPSLQPQSYEQCQVSSNQVLDPFSVVDEEESVFEQNGASVKSDHETGSAVSGLAEKDNSHSLIDAIISLADETEAREEAPNSEVEILLSVQPTNSSPPRDGSSLIPPPLEFSDHSGAQESEQELHAGDSERLSECVTNIDDILFDVSENTSKGDAISNHWPSHESQGIEQLDAFSDDFTGQSVEEFAEQCFNNLESYSVTEDATSFQGGQNDNLFFNSASDVKEPLSDSSALNTASSDNKDPTKSEPKQHFTTISVTTSISSQSPNPANITNILVSSPATPEFFALGTDNVASEDGAVPNSKTQSDVKEKEVVNVTNSDILQLFSKCLPSSAKMSSEMPVDSTTHTTMGVATRIQDGQDEEVIQPKSAIKNAQGKVFVTQQADSSVSSSGDIQMRDKEITEKLADVLKTLDYIPKSRVAQPVEEIVSQEPEVEEEIVPTKLNRAQTEIVVNVLNTWTGNEDNEDNKTSLQDVVAHFKKIVNAPPGNAAVAHTLGVASTGSDDQPIQPMCVTKDHQGKPFFVPVSGLEADTKSETFEVDEAAREELASIMAKMAGPIAPSDLDTSDPGDGHLAEEEYVVPSVRTTDNMTVVKDFVDGLTRNEEQSSEPKVISKDPEVDSGDAEENLRHEDKSEQDVDGVREPAQTGLAVDGEEIVRASSVISVQCTPKQASESVSTVVVQDNVVSPTENKKSEGFLSAVRTFESGGKEQPPRQLSTALRPKVEESADVQGVVSRFENPDNTSPQSEQVVMRPKAARSTEFKAKIESFQAQENTAAAASKTYVSSARPKSMIEVSSSSSSSSSQAPLSKVDQIRKSFNAAEPKLNPSLRPLASLRPLSVSGGDARRVSTGSRPLSSGLSVAGSRPIDTRRVSTGSRPFSGGMFSGSRSPRTNLPHSRQADGTPFQIDVLKGILGLGLKVKVTPEGHVKVTDIQKGGPIEKDGQVRVGDYVTSINSTEVTGQSEVRVQQIIRLLPRGLVKLVVSSASPDSCPTTAPQESDEVENIGEQSSDSSVAAGGEASTHTFILSGNKVEQISSSDGQSVPETTELTLPLISTTQSSDGSSAHPPLTARVEISSNAANTSAGGKQLAAPLKIAIKPTPTPRHAAQSMTKALAPRSPSLPPMTEGMESPKEESGPASRDLVAVPRLSQRLHAADSALTQPGQKRSPVSGVASFKNNREMFEQKSSNKEIPSPLKPKGSSQIDVVAQQVSESVISTPEVVESSFKTEKVSTSPHPSTKLQSQGEPPAEKSKEVVEVDSLLIQDRVQETMALPNPVNLAAQVSKEDNKEPPHSPVQKTPPPVAPKPRLSSSSSTKTDSVEDAEEISKAKPGPKISSGYERLQAITKSSKPSKILEKSRTFVSSKAKMFDAKTEEVTSPTTPDTGGRRVSVGGFGPQDGVSNTMSTSLKPLSERRKSTGSGLVTKPLTLTQQFSAVPKPNARTLPTARRPTEISIPETSPRETITSDGKVKSVVSPTRLNSALSPRRASSADSPTSPPKSLSPRQVTSPRERKSGFVGDKYPSSSPSTTEQSGNFKYSSATVHGLESPVKSSPKSPTAPSPSPHQQTPYHSSKSFTSPASAYPSSKPVITSQVSEEHLENTMKMFDDLLMDAPVVRTETDPVDLLLWAPVRMDSPRSPRTEDKAYGDHEKAPVAKPRSKLVQENIKSKDIEVNSAALDVISPKQKELSNAHIILDPSQQPPVENNIVALQVSETLMQQMTPKVKQSADVQDKLCGSDAVNLENVVAAQVSEGILEDITTPEEKQRIEVQSVLSNQNEENTEDNVVASHVSERINKDIRKRQEQVFDANNKLNSVSERDKDSNIVAMEISNNISENSQLKPKQNSDTNAILCDLQNGVQPAENVVASQISECLEASGKKTGVEKSAEYLRSMSDLIADDNVVANNLSNEIAIDTADVLEKQRLDLNVVTEEVKEDNLLKVNVEAVQSYPIHLTNGQSDDSTIREHAKQIVDGVLAKVSSDPSLSQKLGKVQSDEEVDADDEEEPPPLPGAPPPPLILRNSVMLVSEQDLLDQGGAPVVPEGFSGPGFLQNSQNIDETATSAVSSTFGVGGNSQVTVDTNELVHFESPTSEYHISSSRSPSTEMASSADSVEPLNSTGGSVSEGESHRFANSRSPDDMLSEDSGMPADEEFQEVATDDAMSPPGEFAESVLSLRSVNDDVSSLSLTPTVPNKEPRQPTAEFNGSPVGYELEAKQAIPVVQVCDTDEDLAPPLPSTSLPHIDVQSYPSVELDVLFPQTSLVDSSSLQSSQEISSRGDEVTPSSLDTADTSSDRETVIDKVTCVQEISVSQAQLSSAKPHEKEKEISSEVSSETIFDGASDPTDVGNTSHLPGKESVSSEGTDTEDVSTVNSRRKWCLRSNCVTPSPVLQAESGTSAALAYSEPSLVSALPPAELASLLEKANSILDKAEDSTENLELAVVHLSRQGDSRELGVDLKHDGGIWFRVCRVLEGSPAKADGAIEVGDWLLALDSLWCDQVTVMRLLARLAKPKRDSVLVLVRGERLSQVKQGKDLSAQAKDRPTPAPRPRSSFQPVPAESQHVATEEKLTPVNGKRAADPVKSDPSVSALGVSPNPPIASPQPKSSDSTQQSNRNSSETPPVYSATTTAVVQASTGSPGQEESNSASEGAASGVFKVIMMKGATGVGFCLEGGKGSPKGDVPIIVKRIFKGGPAEKCGQLKVKDEILEVNGVDFQSMRHYEAWNHLKFLDDGEVCITVRRGVE